MFDKKAKKERDITQQMLDRDDEQDEAEVNGRNADDDETTNLGDIDPYKQKKAAKQQSKHSPFPNNNINQGSFVQQS